jgi:hypothetical protein
MANRLTDREIDDAIERIRRAEALADGFQFIVVAVSPPTRAEALLFRIADGLPIPPEFIDGLMPAAGVLAAILTSTNYARTIIVDLLRVPANAEAAAQSLFARLNERRNTIANQFRATLVLAIPSNLVDLLAASAPDLWSIRSLTLIDGPAAASPFGIVDGSERTMRRIDWLASHDAAPFRHVHGLEMLREVWADGGRLVQEVRDLEERGAFDGLDDAELRPSPIARRGLRHDDCTILHLANLDLDRGSSSAWSWMASARRLANEGASRSRQVVAAVAGDLSLGRRPLGMISLALPLPNAAVGVPGDQDVGSAGSGTSEFASTEELHRVMRHRPWTRSRRAFADATRGEFYGTDSTADATTITSVPGTFLAFALIDTAWNCPGVPVIGLPSLLEARARLALAELRIAVMHHPFDELHPLEAEPAREFCSREFDLVLHGPRTGARRPATPKPGDRIIEGWHLAPPRSAADGEYDSGFNLIELGDRPLLRRFIATSVSPPMFEQLDETELDPA